MVSNSEKLSKWAILSVQDPTFLESVKLAYVCDSGNQAFLVTKDDDVFTIGTIIKEFNKTIRKEVHM